MQPKKETKTTLVRKEDVKKQWFLLDASGKTLGRFCAEVTKILRGKHKPDFTPYIDNGDGVIIVNADKIKVTGSKGAQKIYRYYTGHIGGLREIPYATMHARKPDYILMHAIKGMMPKSRLGKQQLRKLRIFKGEDHPFQAQKPIKVEL
ncbi:MAG: 50S ribosomal protein L13 [Chlamydiae bacterium]|nr:50S ribosomal protein L13 [Chlamydiota bacterium]